MNGLHQLLQVGPVLLREHVQGAGEAVEQEPMAPLRCLPVGPGAEWSGQPSEGVGGLDGN